MMNLCKGKFDKINCQNTGLLILRLAAGLMMAFSHGLGKLPPPQQLISGVEQMGFPAPIFFAWTAALSEFLGGIFIALGLFTRPAAFFLTVTMLVAACVVHGQDPFSVKEMALLYATISSTLFFTGAGRYSLDHLIKNRCCDQKNP